MLESWKITVGIEKMREVLQKTLQKWGTSNFVRTPHSHLLSIAVGMKMLEVVAPDWPGSWDFIVGKEGVNFLNKNSKLLQNKL